jgi:hypothetical protein
MKIYLVFILGILVVAGLNAIAPKFRKQRRDLSLVYGTLALSIMSFLLKVSIPPHQEIFGDFRGGYYPAGSLIVDNPLNLYGFAGDYGFVNIPIIALLFKPFAALNIRISTILFTLLGGLAVLAACYLLLRLTNNIGWKPITLIGLFVINGPLYHSLWYGNLTHFVLLLLLAAWLCLEQKRDFVLGILLAVAALIKIPLFMLGVYFALRRKWRVTAGFGATLLAIVGASLLLFGSDLHLAWLHHIGQFSGKPLSAYNVQSVDGFLARLLTDTKGELRNWQPLTVGWDFKLIRYALLSLLVGTSIWVCWRSKPPKTLEAQNLEFSIVLCLALLISPISWTHYYLFLLLPFALYLGKRLGVPQGGVWSNLMLVSILLTSLPVITADIGNPFLRFLYTKLLISHYFFGGIILLGVLLAARWYTFKCSQLSPGNAELAEVNDLAWTYFSLKR